MFFDKNARVGDWREQVLHCRDKGVSICRQVTFALAIAELAATARRRTNYARSRGRGINTGSIE